MSSFHFRPLRSKSHKTIKLFTAALSLVVAQATLPAYAHAESGGDVPQISDLKFAAAVHPYASPEAAPQAVKDAFEEAQKTDKLVMLIFGANWCPDCLMLEGALKNASVAPCLNNKFAMANINVDHFQYTTANAAKFGVKNKAIPLVLLITPAGKVLNSDCTMSLGEASSMSAQSMVNKLNELKNSL